MDTTSTLDRRQAIDYVKARVARLSERKRDLEMNYRGAEGHICAQIENIDSRIDRLLDRMIALERLEIDPPRPDYQTMRSHRVGISENRRVPRSRSPPLRCQAAEKAP